MGKKQHRRHRRRHRHNCRTATAPSPCARRIARQTAQDRATQRRRGRRPRDNRPPHTARRVALHGHGLQPLSEPVVARGRGRGEGNGIAEDERGCAAVVLYAPCTRLEDEMAEIVVHATVPHDAHRLEARQPLRVHVVKGDGWQSKPNRDRPGGRLGLFQDGRRALRVKGPNPRELDACIEQALRGAHVAWPVPLVGVLACGQMRQHLRHACARQREPRAAVGELWLPLPLDNALEVRRREEGVAEVVRLGGVVPGKRGRQLRRDHERVVVREERPLRRRLALCG
mmetsp:Transcript_18691/g.60047  ORF Transcript_18691/g.60047 Transcript_18691/m.60047 type:complete len:285 (-) Transcript_18691:705-1559(-)